MVIFSFDDWLYNGGIYQLVVLHFILGVFSGLDIEWELVSFINNGTSFSTFLCVSGLVASDLILYIALPLFVLFLHN